MRLSLTPQFVEPCFHNKGIFKKACAEVDDLFCVLGIPPIFIGLSPFIPSCAMSRQLASNSGLIRPIL